MTSRTVVDLRTKRRERTGHVVDLDLFRPDDPAHAPGFDALRRAVVAVAEERQQDGRHLRLVRAPA